MAPCGIICTLGLVTLLAASFVQCVKIHEQMTDDEIANFFHTTPDNIPEYEVVSVSHNLYKRSTSNLRLKFNAFGKQIDAYLQPSDGALAGTTTPVWLASTYPNGTIGYRRMLRHFMGMALLHFQADIDRSRITVINDKDETPSFEGSIGDFIIRSLPKYLWELARSSPEFESPRTNRTLLETHQHVIIKSTASTNEYEKLTNLERQLRKTPTLNQTNYLKSKRSTQDIIYPSILITTDLAESFIRQNDRSYADEIVYQLAFWNAVDMRFRRVNDPKIRLRIAGIIIGHDRKATPYINQYRTYNGIMIPEGFTEMSQYWANMSKTSDFPLQAYDIVVTMTDSDMQYLRKDSSEKDILGWATVETFCRQSIDWVQPVAVITDKGGFAGVVAASHELGHIIGLEHDEKTGDECDESHEYIMHPNRNPALNNLKWSPCSLRTLSQLLRKEDITCADRPAEVYPSGREMRRLLPGDIADPDRQCQGRGYTGACDISPEICTTLKCYYTGLDALRTYFKCMNSGPASEGTACSPDHKCLDGICQYLTQSLFTKKIV